LKQNHNQRKEFAMSTITLQQNAITQLAAQVDAIGKLAEDTGAFAATFAAFESNDPDAFRWVLQRLELLPRCELICEWIRVKLCGLRCVEVCGPLDPKVTLPELPEFARALSQLASNEAVLRRVVDAVSCGDAESYQAAIADVKLQRFCHLICRYVCSTLYRRICEVVCTGLLVPVSDPVLDIRADAEALSKVFANKDLSSTIGKAAIALDCDLLRKEIERAQFVDHCEIICRVSCVWRSVWVCRGLCLEPPVIFKGTYAVEEARNFALAARQLAGQPRALSDLAAAVISNNAEAYRAIVGRYGLGPYCWQVCGWVSSELCYEFCVCICPPQVKPPLFTYVGHFDIYTDIDPTSGKTNKGLSFSGLFFNGGPNFAFQGPLQLSGWCPIDSPAFSGSLMKYRFLYSVGGGAPVAITGPLVSLVQVGTQAISWPRKDIATGLAIGPMQTLHPTVQVSAAPPSSPVAPVIGAHYVDPTPFNLQPDVNGWVTLDPNVDAGGFSTLMGFETTQVPGLAGGAPFAGANGEPGGSPAASPPPVSATGTDLSITFQATRVAVTTVDYTNTLAKIHINNWVEVNNLWIKEFDGASGCCTPITNTASVQFTADHEEMAAGAWSLSIPNVGCSPSAPGNITPTASGPGVTVMPRGGWGTIVEAAGGVSTTLVDSISASDNTFTVTSSAGLPSTPFRAYLCTTNEAIQVINVVGTTWTVVRGQNGTTPVAAAAGAEVMTSWCNCSYQVWLSTRAGLTTGLLDNQGQSNLVTFCICGH
jgi:hypothetical protein